MSALGLGADDAAMARRMTAEAGLTAVPVSAFYTADPPQTFLRFCFAKRDTVLDAAAERMETWLGLVSRTAA
jgi:aspartate/methionine/tyrosine aminotransferase